MLWKSNTKWRMLPCAKTWFSLKKFHPPPHKKSTLNNFYFQWKKIRTFDTITYILLTEDKKKTCFHAFRFSFSRYGSHSNLFPSPFIMDILTLVLRKFSLSGILLVPVILRKNEDCLCLLSLTWEASFCSLIYVCVSYCLFHTGLSLGTFCVLIVAMSQALAKYLSRNPSSNSEAS